MSCVFTLTHIHAHSHMMFAWQFASQITPNKTLSETRILNLLKQLPIAIITLCDRPSRHPVTIRSIHSSTSGISWGWLSGCPDLCWVQSWVRDWLLHDPGHLCWWPSSAQLPYSLILYYLSQYVTRGEQRWYSDKKQTHRLQDLGIVLRLLFYSIGLIKPE